MRKAPKIQMWEFQEKMSFLLETDEFPFNLPKKVEEDLTKVEFDYENYEYEGQGFFKGICGFIELKNGMPVLFVNAGGDWETPIIFLLYWDGKTIRGYIPKEGNTWNIETKSAYGNNDDEDDAPDPDYEKLQDDIINRIQYG